MFFLISGVIGGVVTFALTRNIFFSVLGLLTTTLCAYFSLPVQAWGFTGLFHLYLMIPVILSLLAVIFLHEKKKPILSFIAGLFVWIGVSFVMPFFMSSEFMRYDEYQKLIGNVESSEFNEDVAPINLAKVRIVSQSMAKSLVSKRLGQSPSVGSLTQIGQMNIQNINGTFRVKNLDGHIETITFDHELVWAGPLNPPSFFRWFNNVTTEGYVLASATNAQETYLVTGICSDTPSSKADADGCEPLKMEYLLGSYFGDYLHRYLYNNGYASIPLTS